MRILFSKARQEMVSIEIEATANVNFQKIDLSIKQNEPWRGQRLPQSVTIAVPKNRLDEILLKLSECSEITKVNDEFTVSGQALQDTLKNEREEMNRRFGFDK